MSVLFWINSTHRLNDNTSRYYENTESSSTVLKYVLKYKYKTGKCEESDREKSFSKRLGSVRELSLSSPNR